MIDQRLAVVLALAFSLACLVCVPATAEELEIAWQGQHGYEITSLAFSPDGAMIASGSRDTTAKLWRVLDGDLIRTLKGHTAAVRSVAFSPDGALLASGGEDSAVGIWRVLDGGEPRWIRLRSGDLASSVAFSPDGGMLAIGVGCYEKSVVLWSLSRQEVVTRFGDGEVRTVAFSPDGKVLASAPNDVLGLYSTVNLWRVPSGELIRTLAGHTWWINSVVFSRDGEFLASAGDRTIKLWRPSGALVRTLTGHTDWVESVAFSPNGSFLLSGGWDGTIRIWRTADGTLLKSYLVRTRYVTTVAFSPDGRLLAFGLDNGTMIVAKSPVIQEPVPKKGDLNGDGIVNIPDAQIALRIAVGLLQPTQQQLAAGDLDGDGRITIAEVMRILRAAVGAEKL